MITAEQKLYLLNRMLGLKHKLKVHKSMSAPSAHEELSKFLVTQWDLEDAIVGIEQILSKSRAINVERHQKRALTKA